MTSKFAGLVAMHDLLYRPRTADEVIGHVIDVLERQGLLRSWSAAAEVAFLSRNGAEQQ